jgi:hypothetical protein
MKTTCRYYKELLLGIPPNRFYRVAEKVSGIRTDWWLQMTQEPHKYNRLCAEVSEKEKERL